MAPKRTCPSGPSKQCYPTRAAAIRAALSYSRKRGSALRVYWHGPCKSFHLTRTPLRDNDTRGAMA